MLLALSTPKLTKNFYSSLNKKNENKTFTTVACNAYAYWLYSYCAGC